MESLSESFNVYRELADRYDQLGQVSMRDRFLMLAADAALEAGQGPEAERLRDRLLQTSRHHMLRPYRTFAEAIQAPDVQTYLRDLRANYPLDIARQLLDSLRPGHGPAVDQTQPANWSAERSESAIPPTAPLGAARQAWAPLASQSLADEPTATPAPVAPSNRPLAQPLSGRVPVLRPATPPSRGNLEPLVPLPAQTATPVVPPTRAVPSTGLGSAMPRQSVPMSHLPPTAASAPAVPPGPDMPDYSHANTTTDREPGGAWLNFTLVGVVVTAGIILALFTLARPFLPAGWLP